MVCRFKVGKTKAWARSETVREERDFSHFSDSTMSMIVEATITKHFVGGIAALTREFSLVALPIQPQLFSNLSYSIHYHSKSSMLIFITQYFILSQTHHNFFLKKINFSLFTNSIHVSNINLNNKKLLNILIWQFERET